ncbi:MAG TPA: hypothetical protein VFS66_13690 [Acidimicrobiia bacterium]|nr:hypothetical protein [Acidimicrobiia bacterium]
MSESQTTQGDAEALEFMMGYLERRPIDAKAFGVIEHKATPSWRTKSSRYSPTSF